MESGYCEIPKRVTTEELAKQHRQPRTIFEEHIRKAESKVVHAMAPFMMIYAKVPGNPFVSKTHTAGSPTGLRVHETNPRKFPAQARNDSPNPYQGRREIAQNQPIIAIREAISFTLLAAVKEISSKQGVSKTRDGQILRPKQEKSPIIPTRQKTTFQKGGTSTAFKT